MVRQQKWTGVFLNDKCLKWKEAETAKLVVISELCSENFTGNPLYLWVKEHEHGFRTSFVLRLGSSLYLDLHAPEARTTGLEQP